MTCPICDNEASWCDCDPKTVELWEELEECEEEFEALKEQMKNPSEEEITAACTAYRPDYGSLSESLQSVVRGRAVVWLLAWRSALLKTTGETE